MLTLDTVRTIRAHAGLDSASDIASVSDAVSRGATPGTELDSFLDALQQLNVELNGPVPSESVVERERRLPAELVYAVAEVARMLRAARLHEEARTVDAAWLAVLADG